jgi:peptide/nickel transport system substrate-binding protein
MGGVGTAAGGFVPGRIPNISDYPTLDPWLHVNQPNPGDYILERNPYFYKIDPEGQQLPYMDGLQRTFVSDLQVQNLKILAGETDLQFQFVRLSDFPLFKRNEIKSTCWVVPLPAWQDYMLIFPLNLRPNDPELRPIMADIRFRRALSLALNRHEIKESLFLGFGRPAQLGPIPGSPWYDEAFTTAAAGYDPEQANRLLDEMGLAWDAEHRYRLRPDGKTLTIRIDYYDVTPPAGPGSEMAAAFWEEIGVKTRVQQMDGARYWQLRGANENQVTAWWANGAVPNDFTFTGGFSMIYPWQQWHETRGATGQEPPDWAKAVYRNRDVLFSSPDAQERNRAGIEIFRIHSNYLWNIGTVADVPIPFVYSKRLGNISVAEQRNHYAISVAEAAEQWYFKDGRPPAGTLRSLRD